MAWKITTSRSYPRDYKVPFSWKPKFHKEFYEAFPGGRDFEQTIWSFTWLGFEINLCSPKRYPLAEYKATIMSLRNPWDTIRNLTTVKSMPVKKDIYWKDEEEPSE